MKSMKFPTDLTNGISISRVSKMQIYTECEDRKFGHS